MKTIIFCIVAICSIAGAQAQSKDRDVIASTGGYVTTPSVQVSFTLGETAIQFLNASGASISQGFQQPNNVGAASVASPNLDAVITTYPNPFVSFLDIKTDRSLENPSLQLTDATGKTIPTNPTNVIPGKHWRIQIGALPTGNYWLTIRAGGKLGCFLLTHIAP